MAHPKASPDLLPPDVALGVVMIDAAALAAGGEAEPTWIRVTPRGEVEARDGRRFSFDPERLVARFAADGIDVPVDIDHAISRKPMFGERADAVGWVRELAARRDGTYARVELLDAGKAALGAKTHRYVSPTFHHTEAGLATWLHSIALVAAPALAMPALAAADPASKPENTMLKALAKALGLADTADEAACLAAITGLQTSLAGKVDKAVHDQALANLATATTQLAAATAQLAARDTADHQAKVEALLDGALKDKKIVPAQRDHYATLCATPDGFIQVKTLLEKTPAGLQASGLDTKATPEGEAGSPDDLLAKAHALIDTAAKAGRTMSLADAVVQANGGNL
jgi:phage I-like protein